MSNEIASDYLRALGPALWEAAQRALEDATSGDDDFSHGRAMGLQEAVVLLVQRATASGMSSSDVGLPRVGFIVGPDA